MGAYDFGVMDVVTGEGLDTAYNYSSVRVKRDILNSSTLGLLAVSKNDTDDGFEEINSAAGLDLNLQFGSASRFVTQVAASRHRDNDDGGFAGEAAYQYSYPLFSQRDTFTLNTSLQAANDAFDLRDIGYFGRTGLDRRGVRNSLGYSYWIKAKGINRVTANQTAWYYTDFDGDRKVQDGVSAEVSIETISLIRPGFLVERSYYFFPADRQSYDNSQRTFSLAFGPYPRIRGVVSYRTGDNFGAAIRYTDAEVIVKPVDRMRLTANYSHLERDPLDSLSPSAQSDIGRLGFNYLFTPDMYWRVFVQSDSSDKLSLVNTLIRWEYRPGSVFYLSYKETRDDTLGDFMTSDRQLLAKLSYHLHR
jgi:hypothetical protein